MNPTLNGNPPSILFPTKRVQRESAIWNLIWTLTRSTPQQHSAVASLRSQIQKEAHLVFELTSFQDSNSGNLKRGPTALD